MNISIYFKNDLFQQAIDLILKDWYARGNAKFCSNVTVKFERKSEGIFSGELSFHQNSSIIKERFTFSLLKAIDDKYDCKTVVFERTVDMCKINIESLRSNFMFNWIFPGILANSNFEWKCPFKPGFYDIKKTEFALPQINLSIWTGFYCMKIVIMGKTSNSKRFEDITSVGGRGNVIF